MNYKFKLMFLFSLMSLTIYAQTNSDSNDTLSLEPSGAWFIFYGADGFMRGYKDAKGAVMIPPRFQGFTHAETFQNIIAVMEGHQTYYLLKNGQKVGGDSVFIANMTFDCESEEMIRFRNPITDLIGFLNTEGEVAIPAIYSDASSFQNGVAVILEGGQKRCLDKKPYDKKQPCEIWEWKGGRQFLINKKNQKLIEDFHLENYSDLHSMAKNNPILAKYQTEQMGLDGSKYRFNNTTKEFEFWIETLIAKIKFYDRSILGPSGFKHFLRSYTMPEVAVWIPHQQMKMVPIDSFIEKNWTIVRGHLEATRREDVHFFVTINDLDRQVWNSAPYQKYFNDCGQSLSKHPKLTLVIEYPDQENQILIDFLMIEDRVFQLIGIHANVIP